MGGVWDVVLGVNVWDVLRASPFDSVVDPGLFGWFCREVYGGVDDVVLGVGDDGSVLGGLWLVRCRRWGVSGEAVLESLRSDFRLGWGVGLGDVFGVERVGG